MERAAVGLTEKGGGYVAAAGEKQVGSAVSLIGIQTDDAGNAQPFYRVFIVFGVPGAAGDQYGGIHGGFLPSGELLYFMQMRGRGVRHIPVRTGNWKAFCRAAVLPLLPRK